MPASETRVLIIAGYFDWFSGYQETALARSFSKYAQTEVIASDRVSPAFSPTHLLGLGVERNYLPGSRLERDVVVTRFRCAERRSMVWSQEVVRYLSGRSYDLIVQVMPGQILSAAPTFTRATGERIVLYGDNRAMWAELSRTRRALKGAAFAVSKGLLYALVNARASKVFGYTPNTVRRLKPFAPMRDMDIMPLAFSPEQFFPSTQLRTASRERLGVGEGDIAVLAAGKFEQRKRIDWLQTEFEKLADEDDRLRLILVGADSSPFTQRLIEQIQGSRHRGRIIVEPFVDAEALNGIFNAADIAVWPKNPAITIQQAMGTGLAVVLPRNDLVGHLIRPEAGEYFEASDGTSAPPLAQAIARCISQMDLTWSGRLQRVQVNRWLSADNITKSLLASHGYKHVS